MNETEKQSALPPGDLTLERLALKLSVIWKGITTRSTTVFGLHTGLPTGPWVSISLQEHGGAKDWVHFRIAEGILERAHEDKTYEGGEHRWLATPEKELERVLRDFVHEFETPRKD